MKELDCVKVIKLLQENRPYDGTENVKRPPKVGDIGAIVHIHGTFCVVENVNSKGSTIWLTDFLTEEVELYE